MAASGTRPLAPAPLLGEDSANVLRERLGLTDVELDRLRREEVI